MKIEKSTRQKITNRGKYFFHPVKSWKKNIQTTHETSQLSPYEQNPIELEGISTVSGLLQRSTPFRIF